MWYPNIPKIAYFYWDAPVLSYLRYLTILTFAKQNPDWQIEFYYPKKYYAGEKLWNQGISEDVVGKDYTNKISKIPNTKMIEFDFEQFGIGNIPGVYRSDLLRLYLLGKRGGLWSDMDIIYFRPMTDCWFNVPEYAKTDTVISYNKQCLHYSIGFLMSSPDNEFYLYLYVKGLEAMSPSGDYQKLGILLWHKYFLAPENIKQKLPNLNIVDIEMDLCYSLTSRDIEKIYNENHEIANPKTIGFHWYAGHPIGPEWENKITKENIYTWNTTITNTAKRALQ